MIVALVPSRERATARGHGTERIVQRPYDTPWDWIQHMWTELLGVQWADRHVSSD